MAAPEEEESEWNSSKIKGFSFGDDDETPFEELSNYSSSTGAAGGGRGKDEELVITFDSSAATGVVSDKVRAASRIFASSAHSHQDQGVREGGPSISDVVGTVKEDYLPTDPKELRNELTRARRQLSKLELSRFTPLHPKETVKNIFLGRRFSLEFYKSFKDKTDLLDEALKLHDGDAILTVTLFAQRTLNRSKFLELLVTRPVAARHLANYLETRMQISELSDLLTSLGQHEKAAIVHYKQACAIQSLEARTKRIKSILQSQFNGHPDSNLLIQHLHLLERISPVIESDARDQSVAGDPLLPSLNPRNETVLDTLLYFCYHHWGKGENLLHSPAGLKKVHGLSEKQFTWIALIARAKREAWKDCEQLVITKGWLGGRKTKSVVAAEGVVRILHSSGASAEVLHLYLELVDDIEERETLARKCNAPNVVIDCLVAQRDRVGLQRFRQRLTSHSPEWFYADHALNTSNTKWKN